MEIPEGCTYYGPDNLKDELKLSNEGEEIYCLYVGSEHATEFAGLCFGAPGDGILTFPTSGLRSIWAGSKSGEIEESIPKLRGLFPHMEKLHRIYDGISKGVLHSVTGDGGILRLAVRESKGLDDYLEKIDCHFVKPEHLQK